MKKILFPLSLMVIAAMLLAACGGAAGTTGDVTPGAGTESTPAVEATGGVTGVTMEPTTIATVEATVDINGQATGTATTEATAEATSAATSVVGATPEGTATVDTTPTAGTGSTGSTTGNTTGNTTGSTAAEGQFVRLSTLLSSKITTNDNQPAGEVDGVLVEHPNPPAAEASSDTTQATPTAQTAEQGPQDFTVRYVLVDTAAPFATTGNNGSAPSQRGGNIAVIPWQAFDMAASTGQASNVGTITVNIPYDAMAGAPRMRLSEIASGSNSWTGDVAKFWTDQGVAGIPTTGEAGGVNTDNLALIPRDYRGINIADQSGSELGNIADFLIDPTTGVVQAAVFNGGETFGNKSFAVPMTHLTWSGNSGTQLGTFQFNFPNDVLNTAPYLDSIDGIQLGKEWNDQLNQFWSGIQNQNSGSSK